MAAPQKHGCWTVSLHWLPACIPPLHQYTNGLHWGCHKSNFASFFHNKKTSYENLYRESSFAFLEQLSQELAHPHCMKKFCFCKSNQNLSNTFSRKMIRKFISMHERKRRVRFSCGKNKKRRPFCELSFLPVQLFSSVSMFLVQEG